MEELSACSKCGFTTNIFSEFQAHIEKHEMESLSSSKQNFDVQDAHKKDGTYGCDKCQREFSYQGNMYRHQEKCTAVCVAQSFQCNFCQKRFHTKTLLYKHAKKCGPPKADILDTDGSKYQNIMSILQEHTELVESHNLTNTTSPMKKTTPKNRKLATERSLSIKSSNLNVVEKFPAMEHMETFEFVNAFENIPGNSAHCKIINSPFPEFQSKPAEETDMSEQKKESKLTHKSTNTHEKSPSKKFHSPISNGLSTSMSNNQLVKLSENDNNAHSECHHCGMMFDDNTMYLIHRSLHSESDPFKCNLCGIECENKYAFYTHTIFENHSVIQ